MISPQGRFSRGKCDFLTRILPFAPFFVLEIGSGLVNLSEEGVGVRDLGIGENKRACRGMLPIIRRQALEGYLKSKLQALRIPLSFTTNPSLAQQVAKF
jgi:hypothetical protein